MTPTEGMEVKVTPLVNVFGHVLSNTPQSILGVSGESSSTRESGFKGIVGSVSRESKQRVGPVGIATIANV